MKILAFDSTAKVASVAVTEGERALAVYSIDNGMTHSELLLPMAEAALKSLRIGFSDIGAYAVTVGPGSFTGVRIGVSLVKGLAFGKGVPCVPVSTLEALAENLRGMRGIIVPCMDARRAQVYTAIFSSDGEVLRRLTEDMPISISELYELLLKFRDTDIYLVGDGYDVTFRELSRLGLTPAETPKLLRAQNAASVGILAKRKLDAGEYTTDEKLSPIYLRMPQAERERLEKENENNEKKNLYGG